MSMMYIQTVEAELRKFRYWSHLLSRLCLNSNACYWQSDKHVRGSVEDARLAQGVPCSSVSVITHVIKREVHH